MNKDELEAKFSDSAKSIWEWGHTHTFLAGMVCGALIVVVLRAMIALL